MRVGVVFFWGGVGSGFLVVLLGFFGFGVGRCWLWGWVFLVLGLGWLVLGLGLLVLGLGRGPELEGRTMKQ